MAMRKQERREAEVRQRVLTALGVSMGCQDADEVIRFIVASVVDGVRRPGSWERGVVEALFGPEAVRAAAFEIRRDEIEGK